VKLTEEGRAAYAYAQTIFDTGREFMDSLRDRSQKGRLRIQIGVTNSIPKAFAAALLKFILNDAPKARIELHEEGIGGLMEGLRNHAYDIVLSDVPYQAPGDEPIENRLIGRVPIVFCAARSIASKLKPLPRALVGAPLLLPTAHSGVHHAVLEYLAEYKLTPHIVAEIQDVELIHRMALEGIGIAPLNQYSVVAAPWKNDLVIIPSGKRHDIHDSAYLITRERKTPHPLVERILAKFRITVGR
jgi:LysR family transcriptional activator of nhaA